MPKATPMIPAAPTTMATEPFATATATATASAPATARLRLYQLISPALPVGAFSYSEGLEVLVQAGQLSDGAAVAAWLQGELRRGLLGVEAAALPRLMAALQREPIDRDTIVGLDGWLLAQREAAEVRAQQRQMGGSLLQLLEDLGWPLPAGLAEAGPRRPGLGWPVAFAWAGVSLGLPELELVEAYLYGWTATQLSAAVRLVPLGPTEAQRHQLQLAALIAERALELANANPHDLWSGGVGASLAQLGHGELYSRLFRS